MSPNPRDTMAPKKNQTALTGSGDSVLGGDENSAHLPEHSSSQLLQPCEGWEELLRLPQSFDTLPPTPSSKAQYS